MKSDQIAYTAAGAAIGIGAGIGALMLFGLLFVAGTTAVATSAVKQL